MHSLYHYLSRLHPPILHSCIQKKHEIMYALSNVPSCLPSAQELDLLEDGAVVYKLVGPVLIKQELSEARLTVEKRLEYITKEA